MKRIVIIGAGLGGLSAGITLAAKGFEVMIFEQNDHAGGKMMPVRMKEFHFDFGPNTITMPEVFQNVLKEAGENPDEYFKFVKLETHTRNFFHDETVFDQSVDPEYMIEQLQTIDPFGARNYHLYLKEVERLFKLGNNAFFYRTFSSFKDYLSPSLAASFMRVRPFETMNHFHSRYFRHDHVLKVFNRYATYIGSSPYACPATFALIGHLEMNDGVYYTLGGNTQIAAGFLKAFKKLGGKIHFGTKIKEVIVEKQKVKGVILENDDEVLADIVISNGDFITSTMDLIPEGKRPSAPNEKLKKYDPSISAFVVLAGLKERAASLLHHQVYFAENYQKEFHEIFQKKQLPSDPTIYVSHSATSDPAVTKGSNLFILVNAPAKEMQNNEEIEAYKKKIYDKLEKSGVPIRKSLDCEMIFTPSTIQGKFSAYRGALYGISSHKSKDAFLRPYNASVDIHGLYYVGGTTHPGGGSPMVTISGLNVAATILKSYGL
ncbi:phytoene desaturase family protein [Falsibacillus albus]|uniref:Phytoene desaturase n=1 Tax=Falsibacillus albus TaxID=2478915 RepID=A0A3L7JXH5_9BACI|nr:phytoene desaturase family protein [Falsibacillus albus]RLQ95220.1 phytoene desaturase [Falsibacillus albus]